MRYTVSLLMLVVFFSCKKENPYKVDVSNIDVSLTVKRFDKDFYEVAIKELPSLKKNYPRFFPANISDSVWIQKKQSKEELELHKEVQKVYDDFTMVEEDLALLFRHILYYFPEFQVPKVTTVINNLDYDYRVIYTPTDLIVSLDLFLGKEHSFYVDYPKYIKENNTREFIVVEVANQIINELIRPNNSSVFLDKMIYQGKKKFLLDLFLPHVSDKLKSGYSQDKLDWAVVNEEQIWRYFIEKELLYSTDTKLNQRFLDLAPFSKFYLLEDSKSPGQIGVWMGWQIVRSFMEKNDVPLQTLLTMDEQELFQKSKYKPKR